MIRYLEAGNSGTQIQSWEWAGLEYKGSQHRIKLIYREEGRWGNWRGKEPELKPGICGLQPKHPGTSLKVKEAKTACFIEPVTAVGSWATKDRDGQQERVTCLRIISRGMSWGIYPLVSISHWEALLWFTGSQTTRITWGDFLKSHDAWAPPLEILS